MNDVYVLVHGAWHTGAELEPTASLMRGRGAVVHCPTLAGNRPGDDKSASGLADAIDSLVDFVEANDIREVRLVGHSYGGMVISGAYQRIAQRVRRLVYVNAFVPLPGESLNDMAPRHYVSLFDDIASANDNVVMLPFPIWREAFINDADFSLAKSAYERLNPQPYRTFTDKIVLQRPMSEVLVGKSYVNCQQDAAMPHSFPWHPRLSERLGLFRLVECPGSHEIWFSAPAIIADALLRAGRD